MTHQILDGIGLAMRPALLTALKKRVPDALQFLELTPPHWIGQGGERGKDLQQLTQTHPSVCLSHSLSLGGPSALDAQVLRELRAFVQDHGVQVFSEALAWSADDSPLFITLPIPSTHAAVRWTVDRIAQVQEALGMRIGVRNVLHRMVPTQVEMDEATFVCAVVEQADCNLHLDLNALAQNSRNFGFDAHAFLDALPLSRVDYVRVGREFVLLGDLLSRTHRRVARCVDDMKLLNLEAVTC
jgi:uncharacterized protein (UPF0276 family)